MRGPLLSRRVMTFYIFILTEVELKREVGKNEPAVRSVSERFDKTRRAQDLS